jgi:two-component system sensor histidine kinase BaeS
VVLALIVAGLMAVGLWALGTVLGLADAPPMVVAGGLLALVMVVVAVVVVVRVVRRVTAPLDGMIEAAKRVETGDYSARVPEQGPPEVRSMARAFNQMSSRLQETDTRRRSFLADITHELRTPLSVMQAQLEAIADGVYPADGQHLAPALDQVRSMERLVEDLRTLALVESGGLRLAREPVDVGAVVEQVIGGLTPQADEAGIRLTSSAEADLPEVLVDPVRLRSIVSNLVSNALRHTPREGAVDVRVSRAGRNLAVEVQDNGSGIPPDMLPRVFDRFARGAGSSGSGLGLAIAKDLVEAQGGQITATSEVGLGTTMRFTLPAVE